MKLGTPVAYRRIEPNPELRLKCNRWRRRGDSNPRDPFGPNGFQDRRIQPLSHPSVSQFNWQCPGLPSPKGWGAWPAHRDRISHARATLLGSGDYGEIPGEQRIFAGNLTCTSVQSSVKTTSPLCAPLT